MSTFSGYFSALLSVFLIIHLWFRSGTGWFRNQLHTSNDSPLWHNVFLLILYFSAHSIFASTRVRKHLSEFFNFSDQSYRQFYLFTTLMCTVILCFFWNVTEQPHFIYQLQFPLSVTLVALQVIGAIGTFWTWKLTNLGAFLGAKKEATHLTLSPPYTLCRHPSYFFGLLMLITPEMTIERAEIVGCMFIYIWIGATLEEQKLQKQFGHAYTSYSKTTPKLIPTPKSLRHTLKTLAK